MGYYSEVFIGIDKKQKEQFEKISNDHYMYFELETKKWGDFLIYRSECIKWYSTFAEVQEMTTLVKRGSDKNFIVCIGEDGDMHSCYGDWNKYLSIQLKQITLELK